MIFELTKNPYIDQPEIDLCYVNHFKYMDQSHEVKYINDRGMTSKNKWSGYYSDTCYNIHYGFIKSGNNPELTFEQKIIQSLNYKNNEKAHYENYIKISEFYENAKEIKRYYNGGADHLDTVEFYAEFAGNAMLSCGRFPKTIEETYKTIPDEKMHEEVYVFHTDFNKLVYLYDNIYKYNSLIFKRLPNGKYEKIDYYLKNGCGVIGLKKNHHYSPVINYVFSVDFNYNHWPEFSAYSDHMKSIYKTIKEYCITKHFCIFSSFNNLPVAHFTKNSKKILIAILLIFKKFRVPKCLQAYILML